jgi:hypothetical protein
LQNLQLIEYFNSCLFIYIIYARERDGFKPLIRASLFITVIEKQKFSLISIGNRAINMNDSEQSIDLIAYLAFFLMPGIAPQK